MSSKKYTQKRKNETYTVVLPTKGKALKELTSLLQRRPKQLGKIIKKLEINPTDFTIKGIEKLNDNSLGQYSIRISKGDRLFYDLDNKNRKVYILRAGKHDLYRLG